MPLKAIVIRKQDNDYSAALESLAEADLMDGDVTVRVSHSTLNYKDSLAISGRAPVVRRFPMVPGIDFAGTVEASQHPDFRPGDAVHLNGWGVGETHLGGLAEVARVKGDWLLPLDSRFSAHEAMAIGTAGYTAALCVLALQDFGMAPSAGPVVVTGASGGVGTVAMALLSALGWSVVAATGRPQEEAFLKSLGASEIVNRAELTGPARPLGKERWAAGVDTVGSNVLANVVSMTKYGGAVAACGLAGGMDLPSSVAPFILRGVALLGVDSVYAPKQRRQRAWDLLAEKLDRRKLEFLSRDLKFEDVIATASSMLAGEVRGRLVVALA